MYSNFYEPCVYRLKMPMWVLYYVQLLLNKAAQNHRSSILQTSIPVIAIIIFYLLKHIHYFSSSTIWNTIVQKPWCIEWWAPISRYIEAKLLVQFAGWDINACSHEVRLKPAWTWTGVTTRIAEITPHALHCCFCNLQFGQRRLIMIFAEFTFNYYAP